MHLPLRRIAMAVALIAAAALSVDFLLTSLDKYRVPDPASYAMFWDRRGWLYTHLAGGALTLVLGPLQFLRERLDGARPVHRWTGRLYVLGILIGSVGAMGLIASSPAPAEIRVAFAATMLAWLGTAAVALRAIVRGQRRTHRAWMVRNYLVTLAPVAFRLLLRGAIAAGLAPSPTLIAGLLWAGWVLPLLACEVLVRAAPRRRPAAQAA